MNESWEIAMRRITETEGVLACGLRFSDSQTMSFSSHADLENGKLDSVWNHMAETAKAFNLRRFPVSRLRWKFGKCHLGWYVRDDGLAMGILVEPSVQHALSALEAWFRGVSEQGDAIPDA